MIPSGPYHLDLGSWECRRVAEMLVALAVKEPGENWQDEAYNGQPFELPVSWVQEVPNRGRLSVIYVTEAGCALFDVRTELAKQYLVSSSETEPDDLNVYD
jgi:hypothetical protein